MIASPLVLLGAGFFALGVALVRQSAPNWPDASAASSGFGVNSTGGLSTARFRQAPEFTLNRYDGGALRLADLQGQAVVLNFWASWCLPCQDEAALLARAARDYEDQGVRFVGVNIWEPDSEARAFVDRYRVGYPSGPDTGGRILIDYGVTGVPETFFLRPDGTVSRRWVGPITDGQLRSFIDELRA